jgi:hypothetical protein
MFGTKKIYAKAGNNALLIKVGGGYMNIVDFYKSYGERELLKMSKSGSPNSSRNK